MPLCGVQLASPFPKGNSEREVGFLIKGLGPDLIAGVRGGFVEDHANSLVSSGCPGFSLFLFGEVFVDSRPRLSLSL